MTTQTEKGQRFHALHTRDRAFIIPNPWDAGSARLLAHLGFEALATTSAGYAFTLGRSDNSISREETLAYAASVAAATDLPVNADLENCFGDSPEIVAETFRLAAQTGIVGGSIEDVNNRANPGTYEIAHAADRVRAAVEVVRALPFRFTLTARSENFLVGKPDLRDTIKRLQAFQEAGADVLYAPGLTSKEDIAAIVKSVDRPVNVLMGLDDVPLTLSDLSALGVKRVSVGSALCRSALGGFLRAAHEMRDHGTFSFSKDAAKFRDINSLFAVQK